MTTTNAKVQWSNPRGIAPTMPPESIVPDAAQVPLKETEALAQERHRLERRMRDLPGERKAAETEYQRRVARAVIKSADPADPVKLHALDRELEEVKAALPGVTAAQMESAREFGATMLPLLPKVKADAVKAARKQIAKLNKTIATLEAQIKAVQHDVAVAKWTGTFHRSPSFRDSAVPGLSTAVSSLQSEVARLTEWIEANDQAVTS